MALSQEMMELLACPGCRGKLVGREDGLFCPACALRFPVEEGIPILLLDRAEPC